jgi:hypothetical protein
MTYPDECKNCDELQERIEDQTEGFDLEPRLRGFLDLETIYYCYEYPDRVESDKCEKRREHGQ